MSAPQRSELEEIFRLAGPLMIAQGGMMMMGVVDVIVVGRAGALDMAAVALGNAVCNAIGVFGFGVGLGIEPLVAQAHGAGEEDRARSWFWQGFALALLLSLPLTVLVAAATYLFEPSGLSHELSVRAQAYVFPRLIAVPLFCLIGVLRSYLSSRGHKWSILIAVAVANVVNLILDLALVLGWFGWPKLGAPGTAYATVVAMLTLDLILFAAIAIGWRGGRAARHSPSTAWRKRPSRVRVAIDREHMKRVFLLGWPIGAQATIETALFMTVSWAIGEIGEVELAGHSIAVTVASLSFMMALGIATAATARVGFHIGAGNPLAARRSGLLAIGLGAAFMGACGLLCVTEPLEIGRIFTNDRAAVRAAASLVMIAGVFALSDGIQAVSGGALRGAGDMAWPLWAHLGGYWFFGLPIGYTLARPLGMGPEGYWWGLTAALTAIAIVLFWRFLALSRGPMKRI